MTHHVTFVSPQAFRGQTLNYTDAYLTPYGTAFIAARDRDIVFWGFCSKVEAGGLRDALKQKWRNANWQVASEAVGTLAENARAASARLALSGTPFQHSVWHKLFDIPKGHVTSYKGLADELNSAPRAIGSALGANPISLLVPCHRVLAADKALNGYRWGLDIKARILAAEGAIFRQA